MQMHEAKELREAYSVGEAQQALNEGWKLLAVIAGQLNVNGVHVPVYVLGRNPMLDAIRTAQGTALRPVQDDPDQTA